MRSGREPADLPRRCAVPIWVGTRGHGQPAPEKSTARQLVVDSRRGFAVSLKGSPLRSVHLGVRGCGARVEDRASARSIEKQPLRRPCDSIFDNRLNVPVVRWKARLSGRAISQVCNLREIPPHLRVRTCSRGESPLLSVGATIRFQTRV